ncbi:hypothetical protein ACKC9G_08165 [Pokkaliibacter sp. CJK22405]|uniref:hypothetical protein n=1 Tax=Pokkaliibacter sp. CJK22405 TaxID=3384615 RepID=UPI00398543DA
MTLRILAVWFLLSLLGGCTSDPHRSLSQLAKTDIDLVIDAYINEQEALCRALTRKLYKRNPFELHKNKGMTIDQRMDQLFRRPRQLAFAELKFNKGTNAIDLAFDPTFRGDRVFALMVGLTSMLDAAYGNRTDYYFIDQLPADKLDKSARNLEIVLWRLKNKGPAAGSVWLLSNSLDPEKPNLSFERLFGKMIALQDMMATIAGDGDQRAVNRFVQGIASTALFPLGI